MSYLSTEEILTAKQYGFRPRLIEEITATLDKGDYAASIFLDLSKDFHTVNHQILLNKL